MTQWLAERGAWRDWRRDKPFGAGFMGGTHARAYAKLPGVKVVAVSSRAEDKAAKLAAEVGAKAVTDDMAIIIEDVVKLLDKVDAAVDQAIQPAGLLPPPEKAM